MKSKLNILLLAICLLVIGQIFACNFFTGVLTWVIGAVISVVGTLMFRNTFRDYPLSKSFIILMFLLLIFIPFVGKKQTTSLENRNLAPFPEWRWSNVWQFFFKYQVYFDDRFAYRNELVEHVNKTKIKLFNKSAIPDQVTIGKEDWLFLSRKDYIAAASEVYTEQQLDTIVLNLEVITRYFDNKGIKFYFMMIPLKDRIYPEFLPPLQRVETRNSKLDQIFDRLKNNNVIRSVNCKQELLVGKKVKETFYKTDTHWNMFGTYIGYRKLMARLNEDFPVLQAYKPEEFMVDSTIEFDGDLQKMFGFNDVYKMRSYSYKLKSGAEPITTITTNPKYPNAYFSTKKMPQKVNGLRLYLVRDSFSESLKVFLAVHFDYTSLAWLSILPVTEILSESPDILIQEMHEPYANHLLKLPDEILQDTVFIKHYKKTYLSK